MSSITISRAFSSSIIAASAGTGKTYQLSMRFIALLTLGISPRCMIALTFTQKAAGEFFERILTDLAKGASSDTGALELAHKIQDTWNGAPGCCPLCAPLPAAENALSRQHFAHLLQDMVAHADKLHLSTLDSFFNSIVNACKTQLGLSRVTPVTNEAEREARRMAMQDLFQWLSSEEELMADFLIQIFEAEKSKRRSLEETIQQIIGTYRPLQQEFPDAKQWINAAAFGLPDLSREVPLGREFFEEAQAHVEELLSQIDIKPGLKAKYRSVVDHLRTGKEGIKTVLKDCRQITPQDNAAYAELKQFILKTHATCLRDVARRMQQRTRSVYAIVRQMEHFYLRRLQNTGMLAFSDITRLAHQLFTLYGGTSQLSYRLDATFRHWFLDEFQDTSLIQWEALSELLREIATELEPPPHTGVRSLFIVGDSKQSIYGWRGGRPEIFEAVRCASPWQPGLVNTSMNKSYRSSPVIMDFVNLVFRYDGKEAHSSAFTREELPGYIRIRETNEPNQAIVDIVNSLPIAEKNLSIAVIVRTNTEGKTIADYLAQHTSKLPVYLVSDTAPATDSPLGQTFLAFFRWLQYPGDAYRHAIVDTSPLRDFAREHPWSHWRQELEERGYAALVRRMRRQLSPEILSDFHRQRLDIWLREAIVFDGKGGSLHDWILHMERYTQADTPPKNSIQIITAHKSKGLEYDAVILPCFSDNYDHGRNLNYLQSKNAKGETVGIMIATGTTKFERQQLSDHMIEAENQWKSDMIQSGRNLLYVSLTRAKQANYILLPPNVKAGENSSKGLIKAALEAQPSPDRAEAAAGVVYQSGLESWHEIKERSLPSLPPSPATNALLPVIRCQRPSRTPSRAIRTPLGKKETFAGGGLSSAAFGTAVHAYLEEIIAWTGEDSAPAWYRNPRTPEEKAAARALRNPAIRAFFELTPREEAFNEQSVEAIVHSTWVSAVIDRLILRYNDDGSVQSARILDYKTGGNVQDLLETHHRQMFEYQHLVSIAFGIPPHAIQLFIISIPPQGPDGVLRYASADNPTEATALVES